MRRPSGLRTGPCVRSRTLGWTRPRTSGWACSGMPPRTSAATCCGRCGASSSCWSPTSGRSTSCASWCARCGITRCSATGSRHRCSQLFRPGSSTAGSMPPPCSWACSSPAPTDLATGGATLGGCSSAAPWRPRCRCGSRSGRAVSRRCWSSTRWSRCWCGAGWRWSEECRIGSSSGYGPRSATG